MFATASAFFNDLWTFIKATNEHGVRLVTSSAIAALIALYEHIEGKTVGRNIFITLALAFFFLATFLAWRSEHQKVLTRQGRRRIREGLARFQQMGTTLQVDCETARTDALSDQVIRERFAQYDQESQAWLTANLDRSYATRFSDPTGLNLRSPQLLTITRTDIWGFVANRQARLQQFMDDYRDL